MPNLIIKTFERMVSRLEQLAAGVLLHSAEVGFPITLKETDIKKQKSDLEAKRIEYEQTINTARIKYDEYLAMLKDINIQYVNNITLLYGYYGKKNQVLADFGVLPNKQSGRKGPRKSSLPEVQKLAANT